MNMTTPNSMIPDRVIIATDFSPASVAALMSATRVARIFKAKITILHVFQYVIQYHYKVPVEWMISKIRAEVQEKLAENKRTLCELDLETEVRMVEGGLPAQEILSFVQSYHNSILVIGTHAIGGMERFVLGSTAEEILRKTQCPVITVGPYVTVPTCINPHFRKILYATDFSMASLAAVPLVVAFQRPSGASLRVLHVAEGIEEQTTDDEQRFNRIQKILQEHLDPLCVGREEYVVLHENAVSQAIVNEAKQYSADLLILGVRRASAYAAHGSPKIAFQTILAAPCPVLSISS
jgi:nucleotide-binding universal stress UspA family protein